MIVRLPTGPGSMLSCVPSAVRPPFQTLSRLMTTRARLVLRDRLSVDDRINLWWQEGGARSAPLGSMVRIGGWVGRGSTGVV